MGNLKFKMIQAKLADMYVMVEASKLLICKAATLATTPPTFEKLVLFQLGGYRGIP